MVTNLGVPGWFELLLVGGFLLIPLVVIALVVVLATRGSQSNNPNLRQCPDCRWAVSIHATACPRCGCPMNPTPRT